MTFRDREDAGRQLAELLLGCRGQEPLVLALPRGGVPVAFPVALALEAPLEVLVARKLGAPGQPEYALGAVAEGGALVVEGRALGAAGIDELLLAALVERERAELARRVQRYRGGRPLPDLKNHTAILVDDGIATGRTALAAIRAVRLLQPGRLVLAAPVIAARTAAELRGEVDEVVAVLEPEHFPAVGSWYRRFEQTPDEEVLALLERARLRWGRNDGAGRGHPGG